HEVVHKCRITANRACEAHQMHGHEDEVHAHKSQPEVHFAQPLVHHAAPQFRKPIVETGEGRKYGGEAHGEMEVAHHEAGGVQIGINCGLRQEKSTDSSTNEQRDKSQAEQHRSRKAYVCAVKRGREYSTAMTEGMVMISVGTENTIAIYGLIPLTNI